MKAWLIDHWNWVKKSFTMWGAAFALAAPQIAEYLPTVKEYIPAEMYSHIFQIMIGYFVMTRIKTQIKFVNSVE